MQNQHFFIVLIYVMAAVWGAPTDAAAVRHLRTKRFAFPPGALSETNEPPDTSALGPSSIIFQLLGGLASNMLDSNGITVQAISSAMNLFNAEKIKQDMLLLRRGLNLSIRFASFLNRYLPTPSVAGGSFDLLQKLKSKVRIYKPQDGQEVQWVPVDKTSLFSGLPDRVQMVVDYATHAPEEDSDEEGDSDIDDDDIRLGGKALNINENEPSPSTTTTTTEAVVKDTLPLAALGDDSQTKPTVFDLFSIIANNNQNTSSDNLNRTANIPSKEYGLPEFRAREFIETAGEGGGAKHTIRGGELPKDYKNVAEIPLERAFFDRMNGGSLRDSFGFPVRNKN